MSYVMPASLRQRSRRPSAAPWRSQTKTTARGSASITLSIPSPPRLDALVARGGRGRNSRIASRGRRWYRASVRRRDCAGAAVELVRGDITTQATDAIVNAANTTLLGGGGVDGAIHRAGGPQILAECRTLGGCATGEAKLTRGGRLPARFVIPAVGPGYPDGRPGEPELLASTYSRSLEGAVEHGLPAGAVPPLSTGAHRFPLARAAPPAPGPADRLPVARPGG